MQSVKVVQCMLLPCVLGSKVPSCLQVLCNGERACFAVSSELAYKLGLAAVPLVSCDACKGCQERPIFMLLGGPLPQMFVLGG